MNPTELQPSELMQIAADFFESQGIHYRVVGSMASMAYGEPRDVLSEWELVLKRLKEPNT